MASGVLAPSSVSIISPPFRRRPTDRRCIFFPAEGNTAVAAVTGFQQQFNVIGYHIFLYGIYKVWVAASKCAAAASGNETVFDNNNEKPCRPAVWLCMLIFIPGRRNCIHLRHLPCLIAAKISAVLKGTCNKARPSALRAVCASNFICILYCQPRPSSLPSSRGSDFCALCVLCSSALGCSLKIIG